MIVETLKELPDEPSMDACAEAYLGAFAEPPYREGQGDAVRLRERITDYSARDGFRVVTAYGEDRTPVAFGLSVTAYPGDWWRDRVADCLDPEQTEMWLRNPITEVVHVAVVPGARRRGLGSIVLEALIDDTGNNVAMLSCHPEAHAAQQLYLNQGWRTLTTDFRTRPRQLGFWLMAKAAGSK